jgi:3D (Asp-Asp-Asp) domain-containing protein
MFKSAVGNFPINPAGADSFGQLSSSASKISSSSQIFSKKTSDQMIAVFKNNSQASQLGNLNYAINNSLASSSRLSPKGIRDLNDPNLFSKKTDSAVNNASSSLKDTSTKMVEQVTENKTFNNSAQTNLQQLSMPQYSGSNTEGYDLYVRRTVYWAYGSGTDIDSANLKSSTGRQLEQGTSAAVDPFIIPYLSRIQFPDIGVRYATDTGGAVKARTASAGTVPIIDLFFLYKEDALAFAKSSPPYITVKVYPPQSKYKYVANSTPTYGTA